MNLSLEHIVILIPMILVYITSYYCNVGQKAGKNIKFRPPKEVFMIVWPILLLLLGIAWYNSISSSLLYLLITLCLCAWLIIYSCLNNKNGGIYTLLITLLTLIITYTSSNITSKYLLCPLITWILFAMILNCFEQS